MRYHRTYTDLFNLLQKTKDVSADYKENGRYFILTKETVDVYFKNADLYHKRACEELADEEKINQTLKLCERNGFNLSFSTPVMIPLCRPEKILTFAEKMMWKRKNEFVTEIARECQGRLSRFELFFKTKRNAPQLWCLEWANKVLDSDQISYSALFEELIPSEQECLNYFIVEAEKFLFTTVKNNMKNLALGQETDFKKSTEILNRTLSNSGEEIFSVFDKRDFERYLNAENTNIRNSQRALLRRLNELKTVMKNMGISENTSTTKLPQVSGSNKPQTES